MSSASPRRTFVSRLLALLTVGGLVLTALVAVPSAAIAAPNPEYLQISKSVDKSTPKPGETFTYSITVTCSEQDCVNTQLTDAFPSGLNGFAIQDVQFTPSEIPATITWTPGGGSTPPATVGPNTGVTVDALQPINNGAATGLAAGKTFTLLVSMQVPANYPPGQSTPIVNSATVTATNSSPATDSAPITVDAPVNLGVNTTKSWSPNRQSFAPGAASAISLGVENGSNVNVDKLVIQEPKAAADGASTLDASNPFTITDFTGFANTSIPASCTTVQVDAYVFTGGAWAWKTGPPSAALALPSGVQNSDVGGIRVTCVGTIAPGDKVSFDLGVAQRSTQRDSGADLSKAQHTVDNVVTGTAASGAKTVDKDATASYTVAPSIPTVKTTKDISPAQITAGQSTAATISARNGDVPVTELRVSDLDFFTPTLTFGGFAPANPPVWPAGATAAKVVYHLISGGTQDVVFADGAVPAAPSSAITGFEIVYTGSSIIAAATAQASFSINSDEDVTDNKPSLDLTNTATSTVTTSNGLTGQDTDTAGLRIIDPKIAVTLDKSIRPTSAIEPGQDVIASLAAKASATGDGALVHDIVVQDAWDNNTPRTFWDAFQFTSIAPTQVPAGASLTIEVRNSAGTWVALPVVPAQAAAFIYQLDANATASALAALAPSMTPAQVAGIRFTFHSQAGFPAATTVTPNVVFTAQDDLRSGGKTTPGPDRPTPYINTATTKITGKTAGNKDLEATAQDTAPGTIRSQQTPPGPGPDIHKKWSSSTVDAQSGEQRDTTLTWRTSSGYSPVTITDANGSFATPKNTVFDAFNVVGVAAIPASGTPYSNGWYLKYDTVTAVQLHNSATNIWDSASSVPAGGWMSPDRSFVGYTLTPAEQASTTGIRLVIEETPADTAARTAAQQVGPAFDPYAPAPGSGVGSGATDRQFTLTWQIRDVTRSDGTPVTKDSVLNGGAGVVDNTVGISGTPVGGGTPVTDQDHDIISILNPDPGVAVKKTVDPTSGIITPVVGTPAADYPTATWTMTGHNGSTSKASSVRLTDPANCTQTALAPCESDVNKAFDDPFDPSTNYLTNSNAPSPFDRFTATKVTIAAKIPAETDLDKSVVWLLHYTPSATPGQGTYTTSRNTVTEVNGFSEAQLADVVGISVTFWGTSVSGTGTLTQANDLSVVINSRLRPTLRSSGENQVLQAGKSVDVTNRVYAQSYDPVLSPAIKVGDVSDATTRITGGVIDITPSKSVSPTSIAEPDKATPVTVTLGATSAASTLSPNAVVIEDWSKSPDFWKTFDFVSLGAVTKPAGADLVQVDVRTGAGWVTGTPAAAAAIPAGVAPGDVQGIRFTFTRTGGGLFSQTLPAASWNASAAYTVKLRDAYRDGSGPVVFDHTVTNTQTSQATRTDGNDSDAKDAAAQVTLTKGTHRLAVNKLTNNGNRLAAVGSTVPFDLTFQNTGTGYLTVSQLADTLPAQLIPSDTPSVYTKQADGMLSDQVTSTVAPDGRTITFTWPSGGNQMKPNEVFKIRLFLVLQPGLAQGATATNTMTVSTAEELTQCRNTVSGGSTTSAWSTDPKTCGTTDYVGTVVGPNLYTVKGVKGALPGAYRPDAPAALCVANLQATGGSYFRSPCVANSEVGGTDDWVLNNVNAGTVPVSRMTIFDQLPTVGDQLLITGADRGSKLRPLLVDGSLKTSVPAGTTQLIEVTSSPNVCVGTWTNLLTQPVCEQNGEQWSVSDASTDWSKVTGIRVTLDFTTTTAGALLSGQSADVTYSTLNALKSATNPSGASTTVPATDQVAWNQYGVKYLDASKTTFQKIAPNAVGTHLRFGSIGVAKSITGPAAQYAPASFLVDVVCKVGSTTLDLGAQSTLALTSANGYTARIDGIPLSTDGTSCTATEQGSVGHFGETSRTGSPTTLQVTEAAPQDGTQAAVPAGQMATITNDYQFTGLSVTKLVDTQATHGSFGPFGFTLSCTTSTGAAVILDGVSTTVLPFTIAAPGGTWTAPANRIPVNASCALAETNSSAADHIVIVGDNVVDRGAGSATVTPGTTAAAVTVTNGYDAGTLTVGKQVTGTGAALYGTGSFDFTAVCTYRTQSLLNESFSLKGGDTKTFGVFPAGTSCAVTEKTTGGATDASMSPANGNVTIAAPATPGAVSNVVVTATNRFDLASFDVVKSRLGNLLNPGAAGPFTVNAVCTYVVDGVVTPLVVPGGAERQLTAGNAFRTTYSDLPVGATCGVTETETQHADSTTVTVDSGTPVSGTAGTVTLVGATTVPVMTISNTFTAGTISVTKTVSGTGASDHQNDVFGVNLVCTWYGTTIAIPGGADRDVSVTTPAVYTDLPTGAECVLTEARTGNANQVTITANHALLSRGAGVTIAKDTTLQVNVDNRFDKPLPATGSDGRTIALMGGLGLIALLGGILLFVARRRRRA